MKTQLPPTKARCLPDKAVGLPAPLPDSGTPGNLRTRSECTGAVPRRNHPVAIPRERDTGGTSRAWPGTGECCLEFLKTFIPEASDNPANKTAQAKTT